MTERPTLHIDVLLHDTTDALRVAKIQHSITTWLPVRYTNLRLKGIITDLTDLEHASCVKSILVAETTPPQDYDEPYLPLLEVDLAVHCYRLSEGFIGDSPDSMSTEDGTPPVLAINTLPNRAIDGIWSALHFENAFQGRLLDEISRMLDMFRDGAVDPILHSFYRLVLLHGPPGTGKTSLCKALAQKLAIRGMEHYTAAYLAEINANALHSKYFGESGKEIAKAFEQISSLAQDQQALVCVVIDEVETIAGSREHAHAANEVGDALRATNQLLTALDKLRFSTNVIVFSTSNLITAIDSAFVDRVDIKRLMPTPSASAAYEILRSCLNDLIAGGKILAEETEHVAGTEQTSDSTMVEENENQSADRPVFPRHGVAVMQAALQTKSPVPRLLQISERCDGFSGRVLRRLPTLAIARYMYSSPAYIMDALEALSLAVDENQHAV